MTRCRARRLVLGSDLAYDAGLFRSLWCTLGVLCRARAARGQARCSALLALPQREEDDGEANSADEFLRQATRHGFAARRLAEARLEGRRTSVVLLTPRENETDCEP